YVRERAAAALTRIKDPAAIPELLRLLKNESGLWIRAQLAGALAALKEPAAVPTLMSWLALPKKEHITITALQSLGEIADPGTFDAVATLVQSPDNETRDAAIDAVAGFRDDRAFALLASLLADPFT